MAKVAEPENPVRRSGEPRWKNFSGNDLAAGLLCLAIAAIVLLNVQSLRLGTAMRMGPGYLPTALSWILAGFGIALVIMAFVRGREEMEAWRIRPMIALGAAIVLFSQAIPYLGLFTTVLFTVLVGGLATSESRWHEVLLLGLALALGSHILFIVGLGMPLAAWPVFF